MQLTATLRVRRDTKLIRSGRPAVSLHVSEVGGPEAAPLGHALLHWPIVGGDEMEEEVSELRRAEALGMVEEIDEGDWRTDDADSDSAINVLRHAQFSKGDQPSEPQMRRDRQQARERDSLVVSACIFDWSKA